MLEPTADSNVRGSINFVPDGDALRVEAEITGLPPGTHGLHVHEIGDCSAPDGSSAGDHFAPEGDPHGAPNDPPSAHHAGDLGNVTANSSGIARKQMEDDELELDGEFGIIGRAVIVHAEADDLRSQPSGDSGDPVACGVVQRVETTSIDRNRSGSG